MVSPLSLFTAHETHAKPRSHKGVLSARDTALRAVQSTVTVNDGEGLIPRECGACALHPSSRRNTFHVGESGKKSFTSVHLQAAYHDVERSKIS